MCPEKFDRDVLVRTELQPRKKERIDSTYFFLPEIIGISPVRVFGYGYSPFGYIYLRVLVPIIGICLKVMGI